jgi:SNF family Na+-dependent transporter
LGTVFYKIWLFLVRFIAPVSILVVFLHQLNIV